MYADDHAGHTTCATPGCVAFHLFCPDCGGRRHAADSMSGRATDAGANDLAGAVDLLAGVAGGEEYRFARS